VVANNSSDSTRTAAQIEADLEATRQRLTSSVETLIDQVHPNRIKQRGIARLQALRVEYTEKAKSQVFNARGDLRTNRLAAVGGALVGFIAFLAIIRKIRSGRNS
jgi:hypothetical protein